MIHPTAIIHPGAQLGENVTVGPYCVIGPNVKIGDGTTLISHAVVDGHATVGKRCEIYPFACVGMKTQDLKYAGGTTCLEIGDETVIREYTNIHLGTKDGEATRVGSHCLIMSHCHIAHGCVVGNHVIMSSAAMIAGEVVVEDMAILGGKCGVHQFCRIGTMSMVGGMASVTQDIPPYMLIDGNPAAVRAPNIVGLQRRGFSPEARSAIKDAFRLLYREGLNRTQALERIQYEVADLPEIRHLTGFFKASQRGVL
ncbi:MAG: acyl-ACP--UDP-N-acetylglucosamine O-acyltransferase [Kiritimatiellaeota bacterium]|nr:acyl-ACP--UDP-N-acetylglucosamine O-acyltransferase [Kiritimatiellota bacterium]